MASSLDVKQHLQTRPRRRFQVLAVALCVLISMIDGFDVLAVSFTGPSIARDWGLDPARLGGHPVVLGDDEPGDGSHGIRPRL